MQKYKTITTTDIHTVIDNFINDGIMFTAFDITKTLRNDGFYVEHNTVKKELISFDWQLKYKRTFNNTLNAYIYHNEYDDPDEYNKNDIEDKTVNITPNSTQATPNNASSTNVGSNIRTDDLLDKRGRYSVPGSYVADAGFSEYAYVLFENNNDSLIIKRATSSDDKNATVDCKLNIRIPRYVIIKSFGKIPNRADLHIKSEPNKIIVSI